MKIKFIVFIYICLHTNVQFCPINYQSFAVQRAALRLQQKKELACDIEELARALVVRNQVLFQEMLYTPTKIIEAKLAQNHKRHQEQVEQLQELHRKKYETEILKFQNLRSGVKLPPILTKDQKHT